MQSVEAARINAAVNEVEIEVRALRSARRAASAAWQRAPVVLANLLLPLLLELSRTIADPPRQLVASGLLCEQADEVADAFAARFGLRERRRLQSGEWAALWLSGD